jgi:hypothetical protein
MSTENADQKTRTAKAASRANVPHAGDHRTLARAILLGRMVAAHGRQLRLWHPEKEGVDSFRACESRLDRRFYRAFGRSLKLRPFPPGAIPTSNTFQTTYMGSKPERKPKPKPTQTQPEPDKSPANAASDWAALQSPDNFPRDLNTEFTLRSL